MSKIYELDDEYYEWLKARPPIIQELAKNFPSDRLYLLASSNHRVEIHGYSEDGTLIVRVLGKWNKVMFERNVFGIKPADLTECDLPPKNEQVGSMLNKKEAERYIKMMAPIMSEGVKDDS